MPCRRLIIRSLCASLVCFRNFVIGLCVGHIGLVLNRTCSSIHQSRSADILHQARSHKAVVFDWRMAKPSAVNTEQCNGVRSLHLCLLLIPCNVFLISSKITFAHVLEHLSLCMLRNGSNTKTGYRRCSRRHWFTINPMNKIWAIRQRPGWLLACAQK